MIGDELLVLALPDTLGFDGLFSLITVGDVEVATAAATAFDECPVGFEVESSEQSLEDLSPLRFLELFPDDEAPVAVAVLSLDDADALAFFLLDEDEEDPFADDVLDAPLAPLTPGSDVISVNWLPSLMGPLGFALHEPAGETGLDTPKGIVPELPTFAPPTNVFGSSPWN
jgi:hypothetical protein